MATSEPEEVETPFSDAILVCGKCGRRNAHRLAGMEAGDVRSQLKKAMKGRRPRVRILETGCQDVCPKGILVTKIGAGSGTAPRSWVVCSTRDVETLALSLSVAEPLPR